LEGIEYKMENEVCVLNGELGNILEESDPQKILTSIDIFNEMRINPDMMELLNKGIIRNSIQMELLRA